MRAVARGGGWELPARRSAAGRESGDGPGHGALSCGLDRRHGVLQPRYSSPVPQQGSPTEYCQVHSQSKTHLEFREDLAQRIRMERQVTQPSSFSNSEMSTWMTV